MQFQEEKRGEVLLFTIEESRLDSTVAADFKTQLYRIIQTEEYPHVILDFKNVEYVDSSGLGAILFGQRQARAKSCHMLLLNLNNKIKTLIKIAKLDHVLEISDSEEEALKSCGENEE